MTQNKKPYALVTGASSGIGYQYARQLAARGYNLVMVSNEADAIVEKGEMIRQEYPVEVLSLMRDLATPHAAKELFDTCQAHNLEVEVLINNAGMYHSADFVDEPAAYNEKMISLHVYTPAMLTYYFAQEMKCRGKGYVLNMSSITGSMAVQTLALYGATKRFVKNFSRSLHIELRPYNVNVTSVSPGAVATNLYHLSDKLMRNGIRFGLISRPETLAKRGLNAMFGRRSSITPGLINPIGRALVAALPVWVLRLIRKVGIY